MVNSVKFERNSKKELIGRLSREVSRSSRETPEEDLEEERVEYGNSEQNSDKEASDSRRTRSRSAPTRGNLPEVKNGRRILPDTEDPKDPTDRRKISGMVTKGFVAIAMLSLLVGAGIGIRNLVLSSSQEEELSYIGVLPSEGIIGIPLRSPAPSSQCIRVADVATDIGAESYYAVFADSFSVAYAKMPNETAPFASIVKLLSALVIVGEYDLEKEFSLRLEVDDEGNGIELEVGEKVKGKDLLGAALVGSKNDAMYALVQNYPGGEEAFIARMDEVRLDIGMADTSVVNPIGLDDPGQYSTPRDIAVLMITAMRDPVISELVSLPAYTVVTATGRQEVVYATNTLLTEVPGVVGGKTGYTAEAGLSLVTYVDDGTDFVTVVFNAGDRYEASKQLINAVRQGYSCL